MHVVEENDLFIFEYPRYDSVRQYDNGLFAAFSYVDGQHHTIIICASAEEMMQRFSWQPNQFLIVKFIGKRL